ncbi:hypothetical protein OROHE_016098 [Orobanche hederae]
MVMEIIVSVILLLVGIAVLIIIHVCVVGRAFRGHPINSNPIRAEVIPGLDPDDIKNLPCFDFAGADGDGAAGSTEGFVECAVCLDSFSAGDKCRILPKCNHIFHGDCVDSWLLKTGACPICRTGVKTTQVEQDRSSISGEAGLELV